MAGNDRKCFAIAFFRLQIPLTKKVHPLSWTPVQLGNHVPQAIVVWRCAPPYPVIPPGTRTPLQPTLYTTGGPTGRCGCRHIWEGEVSCWYTMHRDLRFPWLEEALCSRTNLSVSRMIARLLPLNSRQKQFLMQNKQTTQTEARCL